MRRTANAVRVALVATAIVAGHAATGHAQATRTWVSGVGDDANPCSRTAPCKTFAGAISKTAAGGEIDALDPGGFGGVTITKAITLDGSGTFASILVSGTNAVVVQAGANDRVVLRGLSITGIGTGINGIRFLAGGRLHVENCTVANFTTNGIDVETSGATSAAIFIKDTVLRDNTGGGLFVSPATGAAVTVAVSRSRFEGNGSGAHVKGNVLATMEGTEAAGNAGPGFWAETSPAELSLDRAVSTNNVTGVRASGAGLVRLAAVTVTDNTTAGLVADTGGLIASFEDDLVAGNPPVAGQAATCELDVAASIVPCPASSSSCPPPVCQAPVINRQLGPCRHCRTRRGVTTCTSCTVDLQ